MTKKGLSLVLFSIFLTFNVFGQENSDLQLHLKKGHKYLTQLESKLQLHSLNTEEQLDFNMNMITNTEVHVRKKKKKDFHLEFQIKDFLLDMQMPEDNVYINTVTKNHEAPENLVAVYDKIRNLPMSLSVTHKGDVFNRVNLRESFPEMPQKQADQISESINSFFIPLPEGPIELEDTWEVNSDGGESVSVKLNYKLDKVTPDFYVISYKGKIESNSTAMEIVGDLEGFQRLDKESCFPLEGEMVMYMDMNMPVVNSDEKIKIVSKLTENFRSRRFK
ncbi:DUF6263 family protein [Aureibacter tunicatorum]|uniref:Outer membrane lipoprotein-sorting protein n=1 Tax=Aureibacter tunicatorum TaxID=866807 RepID=A0AAE3XL69_9BACT|nr:DUF6263 family protein [Aureibacter tunicatorum]MDR6239916.1 hypothetical protein [Aureibacter tunicatorum]BDD04391.1 hypothetical protein AUTU_18740 [Aureibacter tunicatorum]